MLRDNPRKIKATWDIIGLSKKGNGKFAKIGKDYRTLKVIYIDSGVRDRKMHAEKFYKDLINALQTYGFSTSGEPQVESVIAVWQGAPAKRRTDFCHLLSGAFNKLEKPPLVLILLKSADATIFADIKWWADCIVGVPSVCIRPDAVRKNFYKTDGRILANLW